MGWKFWERQQSEAERSLDALRSEAAGRERSAPGTSAPSAPDPAPTAPATGFSLVVDETSLVLAPVSVPSSLTTVVTGKVTAGTVSTGQSVTVTGPRGSRVVTVAGIEKGRGTVDSATVGDEVGLVLRGVTMWDVDRGSTITG